MSTLNEKKPHASRPLRLGPQLTILIALTGIGLLMGFSIAISHWAHNPTLSLLAGTAAVTLVVLVVRRAINYLVPGEEWPEPEEKEG